MTGPKNIVTKLIDLWIRAEDYILDIIGPVPLSELALFWLSLLWAIWFSVVDMRTVSYAFRNMIYQEHWQTLLLLGCALHLAGVVLLSSRLRLWGIYLYSFFFLIWSILGTYTKIASPLVPVFLVMWVTSVVVILKLKEQIKFLRDLKQHDTPQGNK